MRLEDGLRCVDQLLVRGGSHGRKLPSALPPTPSAFIGHHTVGPRWGCRRAVNDRSASDNHGQPWASPDQLNSPFRVSTTGHRHQPIRSRTEQVAWKSIHSWPVRAQHRAHPGLRSRASGIPTCRPRPKMPSGVKPATWLMTPARHSACVRKQGQWYGSGEPPIMR
jgi:hypothetical protein